MAARREPAETNDGEDLVRLTAEGEIDRRDFDVRARGLLGFIVGNIVRLRIELGSPPGILTSKRPDPSRGSGLD